MADVVAGDVVSTTRRLRPLTGSSDLLTARRSPGIADILSSRGDLDEALRTLQEEVLPAFERLADVRSRAVTMGKIADILSSRGDLDEALRIRREEELPVLERLGDVRSLLVGRANLAVALLQRGREGDREEARELLVLALEAARELRIPEEGVIEEIMRTAGFEAGLEAGDSDRGQ